MYQLIGIVGINIVKNSKNRQKNYILMIKIKITMKIIKNIRHQMIMMMIINLIGKKDNKINLEMIKNLGMIMMIDQNKKMRKEIIIKKIIMIEIKEVKIRVMIMEVLMIMMTEEFYVCYASLILYVVYF